MYLSIKDLFSHQYNRNSVYPHFYRQKSYTSSAPSYFSTSIITSTTCQLPNKSPELLNKITDHPEIRILAKLITNVWHPSQTTFSDLFDRLILGPQQAEMDFQMSSTIFSLSSNVWYQWHCPNYPHMHTFPERTNIKPVYYCVVTVSVHSSKVTRI